LRFLRLQILPYSVFVLYFQLLYLETGWLNISGVKGDKLQHPCGLSISLVFMLPIKLPSVNNSQYFVSAHVSFQEYSTVYQDQFHVRRCWSSSSHPVVRESFCPTRGIHINRSMVLSGPCQGGSAFACQLWMDSLRLYCIGPAVSYPRSFCSLRDSISSVSSNTARVNCFSAVEVRQLFVRCVKDLHLALQTVSFVSCSLEIISFLCLELLCTNTICSPHSKPVIRLCVCCVPVESLEICCVRCQFVDQIICLLSCDTPPLLFILDVTLEDGLSRSAQLFSISHDERWFFVCLCG
jgi:hypothetical protein